MKMKIKLKVIRDVFQALAPLVTFDSVMFVFAVMVLVCAFAWTPKKKVVFKKATITFLQWWDGEMRAGALQKLVDDFEAENPAIQVKLERRSKDDVFRYLVAETPPAGMPPRCDVAALDPYWVPLLVQKNLLYQLDAAFFEDARLAGGGAAGADGAEAGVAETFALSGGYYAVPVARFPNFLFYNVTLLQNAGFDRPPKTREEFYDMCKKISAGKLGVYGFAVSGDVWTDCFPLIWQAGINTPRLLAQSGANGTGGANAIGEAGIGGITADAFLGDRAVHQTVAFLRQLNAERVVLPYFAGFSEDEKIKAFAAGRVAMMSAPISAVSRLRAAGGAPQFNITTIPAPGNYSGRPVFNCKAWFAGIPAAGEHIDSALIFLEFLMYKQREFAAAAGGIQTLRENRITPEMEVRDDLHTKASNLFDSGELIEDYYLFDDLDAAGGALIDEVRRGQ
ncbi:MAG: extracellular solute-binding protein [Spirochaetaceae bacterium]|jgi:multiple sugar transport system substrate-binding protein|nr:extracellular solute-binding protein [Spirochaetaceae bacterium]